MPKIPRVCGMDELVSSMVCPLQPGSLAHTLPWGSKLS